MQPWPRLNSQLHRPLQPHQSQPTIAPQRQSPSYRSSTELRLSRVKPLSQDDWSPSSSSPSSSFSDTARVSSARLLDLRLRVSLGVCGRSPRASVCISFMSVSQCVSMREDIPFHQPTYLLGLLGLCVPRSRSKVSDIASSPSSALCVCVCVRVRVCRCLHLLVLARVPVRLCPPPPNTSPHLRTHPHDHPPPTRSPAACT
jgi:hypothetical protein